MSEKYFNKNQLKQLEGFYASNLISSLSGLKPVSLIGTISKTRITNLAIVSSVVHIGSNPALLGFFMRPIVVTRDTYHNILDTKVYTINHITESFIQKAHQTANHFPQEISEFEACGLKEFYQGNFLAPFVAKSPIKIGLKLIEKIPIQTNKTLLIVGEIEHLILNQANLTKNGELDLTKTNHACMSGNHHYYGLKKTIHSID